MESEKRQRLINELLDNALKQYGKAEPRAGLEDCVLAAIQAEGRQVTPRQWMWWPALVACAVLLLSLTTVFLARKRHADTSAASQNSLVIPAPRKEPERDIAKANPHGSGLVRKTPAVQSAHAARFSPLPSGHVPSNSPRSDQFPSPEPLSNQELMLARYVEEFPREAALTAKAQTDLLAQEEIERETPLGREVPQDSQEQNP